MLVSSKYLQDLEAKDGLEVGADAKGVVLVSGALSDLTILPAFDPLVTSYKWIRIRFVLGVLALSLRSVACVALAMWFQVLFWLPRA